MTRTMWDGINSDASHIAGVAKPGDLIAYYVDGRFAWTAEEIAKFRNHPRVTITVQGHAADVCDCETGDLTPSSSASWVRMRHHQGVLRPTIYCSLSMVPEVRQATGEMVLGEHYDIWVADYDNNALDPYRGVVAKQYKNESMDDVSVVYDDLWPHRVATVVAPPSSPGVTSPKWPGGQTLKEGDKGNAVMALQQALHNSGVYGARGIAVDGDFGPDTTGAVRAIQSYTHITVDGVAGPNTRAHMMSIGLLNSAGQANP